jgi:hypothetical protein
MKEIMQNGTISGFPDPAARLFARVEFRAPFIGLSPSVSARPSMGRDRQTQKLSYLLPAFQKRGFWFRFRHR